MSKFTPGDLVQVVIPDPHDPDHRYHRKTGEITAVFKDDLSGVTGDPCHDYLYTVDFNDCSLKEKDFRYDDLELLDIE